MCSAPDVIVALTSTPSRLRHLQPVIESLLRQEGGAKLRVALFLPPTFARTGEAYPELCDLPHWLAPHCVKCDFDLGPLTKLVPALALARSLGVERVLTVDDDVLYPKELVRALLEASDEWPDAAIGCAGLRRLSKQGGSDLQLAHVV